MPCSCAYSEMRIISSCGNIEPLSVFSSAITWVGQLQRVRRENKGSEKWGSVQVNVLVQDDRGSDAFEGQVVSFLYGRFNWVAGLWPNGEETGRLPFDGMSGMAWAPELEASPPASHT